MQLGIDLGKNGNWVVENGKIQLANYLLAKIKLIFSVQRGSWLYNANLGSDIPQLTTQRANVTSAQLKQLLTDAMAILVTNNEISDQNIICTFEQIGIFKFDISVTDISGNYFRFNYTIDTN